LIVDEFAEKRRTLWWIAIPLAAFMFGVMVFTPLDDENDPEKRQVREALYGDDPLGLPWLVVHSLVCLGICIPLPLCIVSTCELIGVGRTLGVTASWEPFSYCFRAYRAIAAVPELRGLYWRVTLTWAWYSGLFIGWIVLTSILGV
jgi:hypothetical protein